MLDNGGVKRLVRVYGIREAIIIFELINLVVCIIANNKKLNMVRK